uniref:Uncharacterized protein n=1 Tax=Oryza rufipogon TaxID=4529 RepID=A0A0E0QHS0_ORYRU
MLSVSCPRVYMSRKALDFGQMASCRCSWAGRSSMRVAPRRCMPCVCFVASPSQPGLAAIDVPAEAISNATTTTMIPERISVSSLLEVVSDDLLKLNNNLKSVSFF